MMFTQIKYPIVIATVSAAVFVFCGFTAGLVNLLTLAPDQCEMTYMFEQPEYIQVHIPSDVAIHSKYKLYAYGEGQYATTLHQGYYTGIPVLFIHGNAGCYKQVRSFASVAYRMHEDLHKPHHFNYFTVDFNGELSGLYGGLLYSHTEFTRLAIQTIQKLYNRPTKVILIGHSMGGLIAKSVFLNPEFDYNSVDIIITLSTPHNTPPFNFDWYMYTFYKEWANYEERNPHFYRDKVLVSVGSGRRDRTIQSHQTIVSTPGSDDVINVLTTHIPGVQVTVDHLQAVWCRQFVKKVCLLTFDLIDTDTLQVMTDLSNVKHITKHHLLGYPLISNPPAGTLPNRHATKSYNIKDSFYTAKVSSRDGWIQFIVSPKLKHTVHVIVQNPPKQPWLYYCTSSRECSDISDKATAFPNHFYYFRDNVSQDGRYVVYLNAANSVDKKGVTSYFYLNQHVQGSHQSNISTFETQSVTVSDSLVYTFHLACMSRDDYWVSVKIDLVRASCSHLKSTLPFPMGQLQFEHEDTSTTGNDGGLTMTAQLLTVTPDSDFTTPQVTVLLDPSCTYTATLEADGVATAANLIRYMNFTFGGLILYVFLGITNQLLGNVQAGKSILFLYIQDITNMYVCILLMCVKVLTWLFPQSVGFLGIDWMTLKPEILVVSLLAMYTVVFICNILINVSLSFTSRFYKVVGLTSDNTTPCYFTVRLQIILCLIGLVTTGSLVNTVNVLLFVFHLSSKTKISHANRSLLLLHFFGLSLQLPTLISWIKNVAVQNYWLDYDYVSRILMLISSTSYVVTATYPTRLEEKKSPKLGRYFDVLKLMTLSLAVTRTYMVVGILYAAISGITLAAIFTAVNVKLKNG